MNLDLNLAKQKSGTAVEQKLEFVVPDNWFSNYGYVASEKCLVNVQYTYYKDYVLVKGQGSMPLTGNCYRCGEQVDRIVDFEFEEKILPANSKDSLNLQIEEYTYFGNCVDITKIIKDNILLSLPNQYLCKEDCKGICPQCFANLNTQNCACSNDIKND